MRRVGRLSVWILCCTMAGCFSGGKVVDEAQDSGGLQAEDAQDVGDVSDAVDSTDRDDGADGADIADGADGSDAAGDADGEDGGCEVLPEICDGQDNDCNGVIDDGFQTGACTVGVGACEATGEYRCVDEQTAECNVSEGSPSDEICSDGADNDCDGSTDEDDAADASTWYADSDGDGFGDPDVSTTACEKPAGFISDNTDCDDSDGSLFEALQGFADQDRDGFTAGSAQTICTGGALPDGFTASRNAEDCDDISAAINPTVDEICGDGTDNDCDGSVDDPSAIDSKAWYVDCDGDGFAADMTGSVISCDKPAHNAGCSGGSGDWTDDRPASASSIDCNDDVADAYPGQTAYFSLPMTGSDFNEKWDYDCDGFVDNRYTSSGATCNGCDFAAGDRTGWTANYSLSCGQTGDYQKCLIRNYVPYGCEDSVESRTQECH